MQSRYKTIRLPEIYWCVDTLPIWIKYRKLACMLSQSLWPSRTVPTRQSMGFFRQEYWSGLLFPAPGNLPNPGIKPASPVAPALAGTFFTTVPLGNPSVQFSSVAQSCPTLCTPMSSSTPGLPVHHQLPEFTQTHIHRASDAIQPSHPLSSHFPPDPNPSQHQSLFQWVNSLYEVAKVLEFQL